MYHTSISNVDFYSNIEISDDEALNYIQRGIELYGEQLYAIEASIDPEDSNYICLNYKYGRTPFERIRRITGYLVGTLDRFNDAKRAEESDRVKHEVEE